jgi:hypothetical protein
LAVFNYYTPPGTAGDPYNYPSGCTATALAQILRYYKYPSAPANKSYSITYDGKTKLESLHGGDGVGGKYDWANMPLSPDAAITPAQQQAIGHLLHDTAVVNGTSFATAGSAGYIDSLRVKTDFGYANIVEGLWNNQMDKILLALRTNLDAAMPVLVVVENQSGTSHQFVCDGYGYNSGTLYHHCNMGWSGAWDAWYNLPDIKNAYTFTSIQSVAYNIHPSVSGEVVSGRISDPIGTPIADLQVTLSGGGQTMVTQTNSRGVFAFKGVSSSTVFTVSRAADARARGPISVQIKTGASRNYTTIGNVAIDDFQYVPGSAVVSQQPSPVSVTAGDSATFSVEATGTNLTYQWQKNGNNIVGATTRIYAIGVTSSLDAGEYSCVVGGSIGGKTTSISVPLTVAPLMASNPSARLCNISARTVVSTGSNVQVAGFVISGPAPKRILIRASGPALLPFGVSNAIPDPVLELHDSNSIIASNDNWDYYSIQSVAHPLGAFDWVKGSKDAAVVVTLQPGNYSAIVQDKSGKTGVALVEVYEVDAQSRLVNISTRSSVATGTNVQTAGFIINGTGLKTVLIRASGPALTKWLTGVLPNPTLTVYDSSTTALVANDDWDFNSIQTIAHDLGAFDWSQGSTDSAILMTLPPGAYSAVVSDKSGNSGIGLVEVYEVNK